MNERYENEIESIREETNQRFNQIMAMIQQNPRLAQVKPEVLIREIEKDNQSLIFVEDNEEV